MSLVVRLSAAAVAVSCLSVSQTFAADTDNQLEQVVVTASRVEQSVSDVIGSVTVITREEIERRNVQSVQDLLRGEAGIEIYNNGGLGKVSAISMRGGNAAQTLVLVDGQRLGSATDGTTSIQFIPVDQIERIEIIRGPRSSLYGSDAMGGVIQIFTRQASGFNASLGFGSHNTQDYTAGFGFKAGDFHFNATGNYLQSDGFNACQPSLVAGCYANEPDDDGYRNSSGNAHLGYAFGKLADLEFSALYAEGYTEYDGYTNQGRFKESSPGVKLGITPIDTVSIQLQGGITHDDQDYFSNGQFLERLNTKKTNGSALVNWKLNDNHSISGGIDYLQDSIDTIVDASDPSVQYAATKRTSHGEFVQYLSKLGDHELSASARRDHSSQYGSYNTGDLGWKWFVVGKAFAINAGWGKAFHAPTFNDLYYPFGAGNPNLVPEHSSSVEFGASGEMQWINWSLQAFSSTVHDLIALDSNFYPINTEAKLRGLEAIVNGHWSSFNAGLTYTLLDPRSRQPGDNYNHLLPRRARQSGRIDVGYDLGPVQLSSIINIVGPRYDDLANSKRLPGYTTVDFNSTIELNKAFSLQLKLANFFDRQYQTAQYYNQDGRAIYLTLRYRSK